MKTPHLSAGRTGYQPAHSVIRGALNVSVETDQRSSYGRRFFLLVPTGRGLRRRTDLGTAQQHGFIPQFMHKPAATLRMRFARIISLVANTRPSGGFSLTATPVPFWRQRRLHVSPHNPNSMRDFLQPERSANRHCGLSRIRGIRPKSRCNGPSCASPVAPAATVYSAVGYHVWSPSTATVFRMGAIPFDAAI